MKLFPILTMLLLALTLTACASTGETGTKPLDPAQADATIQVKGMSCPQCANNIKDIMERMDAVDQSRVDLGEGRVLVSFTKGQTASEAELVQAVIDAGFTPGEVTYKNKKGS